jgi:hypothetical protein
MPDNSQNSNLAVAASSENYADPSIVAWRAAGKTIPGAGGPSLTIPAGQQGPSISCRLTWPTGGVVAEKPVYPLDWASISARKGPKAPAGTVRRTNKRPTIKSADSKIGNVDPRVALFEYGRQRAFWDNFWSTSANATVIIGGVPTQAKFQSYGAYSGIASTSPRILELPDTETSWQWIKGKVTCSWRQAGFESNEALVGTDIGELYSFGTQTSRGGGDWKGVLQIANFVITAVTTTSQNELALAIGFDALTKKAKVAVIVVRAKWIAVHTMQRSGQPNQCSFDHFKLLGLLDLPFDLSSDDPGFVAAASNGKWIGPSQTAGADLGFIDFSTPEKRAGLRSETDPQWGGILATKAIALMGSQKGGKVFELDLTAFISRLQQDYTEPDQAKYLATVAAEVSDTDPAYPPTFAEAPELTPKWGKSYEVPGASCIYFMPKLSRWGTDYWKAFVGGFDGFLTVIDMSASLIRWGWEQRGPGGILIRSKIGASISCITPFRYDNDWVANPVLPEASDGYTNEIVVCDRGAARVYDVASYRGSVLKVVRTYVDDEMIDPHSVWKDDRTNMLVVADGDGCGILQAVIGGVPVPVAANDPDQTGSFIYVSPDAIDAVEWQTKLVMKDPVYGIPMPVADVTNVNVN